MIKTKKLQVQNAFDDMVNQLNNKRESIIADLDSKEKSLISEVNKNPRIWNSKSLNINLKTSNPDFSTAVNLDVTITQVGFRIDISLSVSKRCSTMIKHFFKIVLSSINVSVFSGDPTSTWKETNFSGSYSFVETVNDRPVYKVSLVAKIEICFDRILSILLFSETKIPLQAEEFLFGTIQKSKPGV